MTEEIIARLRSLDLSDGGSHSRLSAIASCFYQPTFGWTRGACETLRDKLIETLEDKDGNNANDHSDGCNRNHHCCDQHQVSYDELGNERHKAVCRLRNMQMDTGNAIKKLAVALGLEWNPDNAQKSVALLQNRLIHLLGGDQPTLSDLYGIWQDGEKSENKGGESARKMTKIAKTINLCDKSDGELMENCENHKMASITDELRKWASDHTIKEMVLTTYPGQHGVHGILEQLIAIADRIDEQFDRICEQQEKVLQDTIDYMCKEQDRLQERLRTAELGCDANHRLAEANAGWCDDLVDLLRDASREYKDRHYWKQVWHDRAVDMRMERDELQAKLEEMLKTHVELPKDENDEYIHVEDVMDGYGKTIEVVELRYGRSGWMLISRDGNGYADTFAFAHHHEPTVEQVIRDLTLGKITESQAVERIEVIYG